MEMRIYPLCSFARCSPPQKKQNRRLNRRFCFACAFGCLWGGCLLLVGCRQGWQHGIGGCRLFGAQSDADVSLPEFLPEQRMALHFFRGQGNADGGDYCDYFITGNKEAFQNDN